MTLDSIRTIINGRVRFVVIVDGVRTVDFGSQAMAWEHMDALWDKRPHSDRTAEALWPRDAAGNPIDE